MRIPLFPLGVVLLPGMPMPLHIFEERYKLMISECLDAGASFGIIYFDGQEICSMGCLARIGEVVQRYDDGRMDILILGQERFIIHELIEDKLYIEANVTLFDDNFPFPEEDLSAITDKAKSLLHKLSDAAPLNVSLDELKNLDIKGLSFVIASLSAFTHEEQQYFLEMRSSADRLKKSVNALTAIVERSRLTQEIHRIIGGNGHPPKKLLKDL